MPDPNPDSYILRVESLDGTPHGTGFLIAEQLAVTCAHVVASCGAGPGGRLGLTFCADGSRTEAEVLTDGYHAQEDVAFLRLFGAPPPGVVLALLGPSPERGGHLFRTLGYPHVGDLRGVWAGGEILGRVARERGATLLQLRSQEIAPGMSGAPVVETGSGRVVGMVTQTYRPDETLKFRDAAFAIPAETFGALRPELALPPPSARRVQIFVQGELPAPQRRAMVMDILAAALGLSPEEIALYGDHERLPLEAAERLRWRLLIDDPELRELGLESAVLELGLAGEETWTSHRERFGLTGLLADLKETLAAAHAELDWVEERLAAYGPGADPPSALIEERRRLRRRLRWLERYLEALRPIAILRRATKLVAGPVAETLTGQRWAALRQQLLTQASKLPRSAHLDTAALDEGADEAFALMREVRILLDAHRVAPGSEVIGALRRRAARLADYLARVYRLEGQAASELAGLVDEGDSLGPTER